MNVCLSFCFCIKHSIFMRVQIHFLPTFSVNKLYYHNRELQIRVAPYCCVLCCVCGCLWWVSALRIENPHQKFCGFLTKMVQDDSSVKSSKPHYIRPKHVNLFNEPRNFDFSTQVSQISLKLLVFCILTLTVAALFFFLQTSNTTQNSIFCFETSHQESCWS